MNEVTLATLATELQIGLGTNYSTSGYPTIAPQTTVPVASSNNPTGVIDLAFKQGVAFHTAQNGIKVIPFGVGTQGQTFNLRVIGWSRAVYPSPGVDLWVPVNLLEVTCTIATLGGGSVPGVAGTLVPATNNFCDTIVVVTGSTLGGEAAAENIVSPANGTIAHFLVDARGSQKLQIITNGSAGSATSANWLWSLI